MMLQSFMGTSTLKLKEGFASILSILKQASKVRAKTLCCWFFLITPRMSQPVECYVNFNFSLQIKHQHNFYIL